MITADKNYCQIVMDSLAGKREVDEKTMASVAILREKLERLKSLNEAFNSVAFSAAVEKLINQQTPASVG